MLKKKSSARKLTTQPTASSYVPIFKWKAWTTHTEKSHVQEHIKFCIRKNHTGIFKTN